VHQHLADCTDYDGFIECDDDEWFRIRSEEFEAIAIWLLWRVGHLSKPHRVFPIIDVYHKYKKDPVLLPSLYKVADAFNRYLEREVEKFDQSPPPRDKVINPTPLIRRMQSRFGPHGALMACEMFDNLDQAQRGNPWVDVRVLDWKNIIELQELFSSESLETLYGEFIDQRFVDYLAANLPALDRMNWRKFEGLTAEYFARQGYDVDIGPGRGDDGVDVRVWQSKQTKGAGPPLILVQCKRQKSKIEKVVVKALWADVVHENAKSGLIVTTSRLSPGAENTMKARAYPVEAIDRIALAKWLNQMRSPGTGVYLGE
jgi:restriction system protein